MTIGVPTAAAAAAALAHHPHHSHMASVKTERPADNRQLQQDEDDERRRATTAMAIVELLATGGGSGNGMVGPTLAPLPSSSIWLGNSYHNNANTMSETNNTTTTSGNNSRPINTNSRSSSDSAPSFPGLAALLPMKRPLWKTSGTGADTFKTNHVHIQPLPSIAQLSKLVVSDRSSPTRIDAVAANNSAVSASPTLTPTATPPPTSTPAAISSAAAVSVNHSRKRQKDELDKLRVQVQELQRELDHVRGRLPKRPQQYAVNGATGLPDMHASLPSSVTIWERIASHQKEQKNKSEMENMKLKSMVQEQVKISKALEKLVNKRCKNSVRSATLFALLVCLFAMFTCDMSHLTLACLFVFSCATCSHSSPSLPPNASACATRTSSRSLTRSCATLTSATSRWTPSLRSSG